MAAHRKRSALPGMQAAVSEGPGTLTPEQIERCLSVDPFHRPRGKR